MRWRNVKSENPLRRNPKTNKRNQTGEANPRAKLDEDDVRYIRSIRQDGKTYRIIAILFGVSESLVKAIVDRKVWRHVA